MNSVLVAALFALALLTPCARAENLRVLDAAALNANLSPPTTTATEIHLSTWPLIVPKELLKAVPRPNRARFLSTLFLVNGAIAEMRYDDLRKYLGSDTHLVLEALAPNPGDGDRYYYEKPARYTRLELLLKDVPEKARREFLDNLAFENGHLISAYVAGLRKRMSQHEFVTLLDQLACNSGKRPAAPDGALCGAGWCTGSSCRAVGDIPNQRPDDIACFSSCLLPR